jgi:acyl carrier protein
MQFPRSAGLHNWTKHPDSPLTDAAQPTETRALTNTRKWDSLRQVMLMTELETTHDNELTDDEMTEANSVGKIRTVLKGRGAA